MWVADHVLEVAERDWYDVDAIRGKLAELSRQVDAGEIDEPDFLEQEEVLLDRLDEATAWHAGGRHEGT
jgi:hypothetical protein